MQDSELKFTSPYGGMQLLSDVCVMAWGGVRNHVVRLRKETVRALWDTGAVTSSVSLQLAERIGYKVRERVTLQTASGYLPAFKDIMLIDVLLDGTVVPVKVAVVESLPALNIDFLVGMDIIQLGKLTVELNEDTGVFEVSFKPKPGRFKTPREHFLGLKKK